MAALQEQEYVYIAIWKSCSGHTKTVIVIRTITGVWELSLSTALVVSSTELSEKEKDGRWGPLPKQWTSLSPSLSVPSVSRLNLHNITIQCLHTHIHQCDSVTRQNSCAAQRVSKITISYGNDIYFYLWPLKKWVLPSSQVNRRHWHVPAVSSWCGHGSNKYRKVIRVRVLILIGFRIILEFILFWVPDSNQAIHGFPSSGNHSFVCLEKLMGVELRGILPRSTFWCGCRRYQRCRNGCS